MSPRLPAWESTPLGKIAALPVFTQVIRVLMRNRWDERAGTKK